MKSAWDKGFHCGKGLSQSEAFLPLSLGCSRVKPGNYIIPPIKVSANAFSGDLALGFWHQISVLETGIFVVDWKVGLSQVLAAAANSKNIFLFFYLLSLSGSSEPVHRHYLFG